MLAAFTVAFLAWMPIQTETNPVALGDLTVRGDRLSYDQATGRTFAQGHVTIEGADAWLTADYAEFDEANQVAFARGTVTLSAPMRFLRGDELTYDFAELRGDMKNPDGWDSSTGLKLRITGSLLAFEEGRWALTDAHVRSSDRDDASYQLWADTIEYAEGRSWYGTNVRIEFLGIEVLKTSDFEQRVTDFGLTGLAWVPMPGSSEQDGLFAEWTIHKSVTGDLDAIAMARYGTRSKLAGRVTLKHPVGDDAEVWATGAYRELVGGQLRPFLRWDRLEAGTHWRLTSPDADWLAAIDASYGYFRERPSLVRTTRTNARLTAQTKTYTWGDDTKVFADGGVDAFLYGSGRQYGFAWLGGYFDHRFDQDWRLWGGLIGHAIKGRAELVTDEVVIPLEARLGARARLTSRFAAEGEVRYDLDQGRVRYTVLGLRYRSADFVYRLRYNVETRFLSLDLLLPDS